MRLIRIILPVLTIVFIILSSTGCATITSHPPRPARINHVVFIQLNDPDDSAELIEDCDTLLATIPSVTSYYAGQHIDVDRGDRVDSNYDVGCFIGFETVEAYLAYVEHPNHIKLVNAWRPRMKSLVVRDVLDETP